MPAGNGVLVSSGCLCQMILRLTLISLLLNSFAPVIFFIAFREALEAALVIGILTGLLESLVKESTPAADSNTTSTTSSSSETGTLEANGLSLTTQQEESKERKVLISKLRKLVFLGAATGLFVSFCIGAAFLAVFYTQTSDLYGKS